MKPESIAWLVYGASLLYWWVAAIMALLHFSRYRQRPPKVLAQVEQTFGIRVSVAAYCGVIWLSAGLVTLGALWIPRVWTPIIKNMLDATPTI